MVDNKVRCKEDPQRWVIEGSPGEGVPTSPQSSASAVTGAVENNSLNDSEGQNSTSYAPRHKSADDAKQYAPAEELDKEVVEHSELWKWVDAPVFVPRKPFAPSAGQYNQPNSAG